MGTTPYNPLDKLNLGVSIANAVLTSEIFPIPPAESFTGAGIYLIYYTGDFGPYSEIADRNRDEQFGWPLYVGRAVPKGARKGASALKTTTRSTALYSRLRKHSRTIDDASNLNADDFRCRYLVIDDIWIPLAEALLISRLHPIWNRVIDGFGNNDPGAGRYSQQRSAWDVLHPGREWAERCAEYGRSEQEIVTGLSEKIAEAIEAMDNG